MGPMLYVMAILGCGDAGTQCEQIRIQPVQYATAESCFAAAAGALEASADLAFPEVTAECRGVSAAQAAELTGAAATRG